MTKLTITELTAQSVELLPERNTLFFDSNWAGVYATNTSTAVNAVTAFSEANSLAAQAIFVSQS